MRKFWISFVVALLLSSGVTLMVKYWPKTLSEEECGPLYRQYAHVPGIEASYVKGFRVNDTLTIDATLLRATDSAGWARLREELRLPAPTPIVAKEIEEGKDAITLYLNKKGSVAREMDMVDLNNNDAIGISFMNHTVSIYHIHGREELMALTQYTYKDIH